MVEILKKYSRIPIILSLFGVFLASCSVIGPADVWLEKVKFRVAEDVNNNAPVGVHLLIIHDKDIYKKLIEMPADRYFSQASQLKRDFEGKVDLYKWELVPGQNLKDQDIAHSALGAVGILIFARYSSPGDHRISIADDKETLLILERSDFRATRLR